MPECVHVSGVMWTNGTSSSLSPWPSVRHFHLVTSHMLPSFLVGALPLSTPEMYLVFIVSGWAASTFSAQGSLPREKSLLVPWSYPRDTGVHIHARLSLSCLCILSLHSFPMPLFTFLGKHVSDSCHPSPDWSRLYSLFSSFSSPSTQPTGIHQCSACSLLESKVPGNECST